MNFFIFSIVAVSTLALLFMPQNVYAYCASSPCGNLSYHGHEVLHGAKNFIIFWLPNGINPIDGKPFTFDNPSIDLNEPLASDTNYENLVERYFNDVCDSKFYKMLDQYPGIDANGNNKPTGPCTTGGIWMDTDPLPTANGIPRGTDDHPLKDYDIMDVIEKARKINNWDIGFDSNEYFVFLPYNVFECATSTGFWISIYNGCMFTNNNPHGTIGQPGSFCAYHSQYMPPLINRFVTYAVIGDAGTAITGKGLVDCNFIKTTTNGDTFADNTISATAHEQFESVTDPYVTGWYFVNDTHEIGDECAADWLGQAPSLAPNPSSTVILNGHPYQIQPMWDNTISDCGYSGAESSKIQNFASISCSPNSLDIALGSFAKITCTITPLNGFSGTVNFYPSSTIFTQISLDTYSLMLSQCTGQQCTSTKPAQITLTIPSDTTALDTYDVTLFGYITSTTGILHTASNKIEIHTVPHMFSISASPNPVNISGIGHLYQFKNAIVPTGGTATTTLTITSNFEGIIDLSTKSSGITANLQLNQIHVSPGTTTDAVNISVPSQFKQDVSSIIITGYSGTLSSSDTINVNFCSGLSCMPSNHPTQLSNPALGIHPTMPSQQMIIESKPTQSIHIQSWVKNTAKFWSQGKISDAEFMKTIQYLVDNKILTIHSTSVTNTSGQQTSGPIPQWFKTTTKSWSSGNISDQDFVSSLQYVINTEAIKADMVR